MSRHASIPASLKTGPFTLQQALGAGISERALRSRAWRRVGKAMYCWNGTPLDQMRLLAAWDRVLNGRVVFSGSSAAYLHGLKCFPSLPVEVTAPQGSSLRSCNGLVVRHCDLPPADVVEAQNLETTTLLRTLRDLCFKKPPVDALCSLDEALYRGLANAVTLMAYANETGGLPGAARMRRLAALAEPAESPMETRTRWILMDGALPRPGVQVDLHDAKGEFIGRADMYYPGARLVIEFDGRNHQDRLIADTRRQNLLVKAGFKILRFTSADVFGRPDVIVSQVREALAGHTASSRHAENQRNNAA